MTKYVALLRGINIGPHKKVPMKDLQQLCTDNGLDNVKTLLNTGNIVFTSSKKTAAVKKILEQAINNKFGFEVPVIVYKHDEITSLIQKDVFKKIKVTAKTRLYCTFSQQKVSTSLTLPFTTNDKAYTILTIQNNVICSVLNLEKAGSIDAMKILEQEFGKNVTTRNYNTILKIATV